MPPQQKSAWNYDCSMQMIEEKNDWIDTTLIIKAGDILIYLRLTYFFH